MFNASTASTLSTPESAQLEHRYLQHFVTADILNRKTTGVTQILNDGCSSDSNDQNAQTNQNFFICPFTVFAPCAVMPRNDSSQYIKSRWHLQRMKWPVKYWLQSLADCHGVNISRQLSGNYCTIHRRAQPWQRLTRSYFAHSTVKKMKVQQLTEKVTHRHYVDFCQISKKKKKNQPWLWSWRSDLDWVSLCQFLGEV